MSSVQQNSYEKRSASAKNNAAIAALAMLIAKENKDPLFTRTNGFKKRFIQMKAQIIQKYMAQAKSRYFGSRSSVK